MSYADFNPQDKTLLQAGLQATDKAIPGREDDMVKNNEGKFVFSVELKTALERFLILGTTSGTFYTGKQTLTAAALNFINGKVINEEGWKSVLEVVDSVIVKNRAPSKSPLLLLLAYFTGHDDAKVREDAFKRAMTACTTGSSFLEFVSYMEKFRGWGRMTKKYLSEWYISKTPSEALFQCEKYPNRFGWSHKDVLRKLRIKPANPEQEAWMGFVTGKQHDDRLIPTRFKMKSVLSMLSPDEVVGQEMAQTAVEVHGIPREFFPGAYLKKDYVWRYLFDNNMPNNALISNLATLESRRVFDDPVRREALHDRLVNGMNNVHPWKAFMARSIYAKGKSMLGSQEWDVNEDTVKALGKSLISSFESFKGNGKRKAIFVDTSQSMRQMIQGSPISAVEAASALAFIIARTEPFADVYLIDHRVVNVTGLEDINLGVFTKQVYDYCGGPTHLDAVLEVLLYGNEVKDKDYEEIIFLTDNETNGRMHTQQLLEKYRNAKSRQVKQAVIGFTATQSSIADPKDPNSMDFVGFDASGFNIMYDFLNK